MAPEDDGQRTAVTPDDFLIGNRARRVERGCVERHPAANPRADERRQRDHSYPGQRRRAAPESRERWDSADRARHHQGCAGRQGDGRPGSRAQAARQRLQHPDGRDRRCPPRRARDRTSRIGRRPDASWRRGGGRVGSSHSPRADVHGCGGEAAGGDRQECWRGRLTDRDSRDADRADREEANTRSGVQELFRFAEWFCWRNAAVTSGTCITPNSRAPIAHHQKKSEKADASSKPRPRPAANRYPPATAGCSRSHPSIDARRLHRPE